MILLVLPEASPDPLLERIQHGDESVIGEVYAAYFAPLYHYARLKTGDRQMAEDIVSEVFVTFIHTLGRRSAPRVNLRGWLFRVARHEIARHYGKDRPLPLANLEEWMPASPESNPERLSGDIIETERLRHALRMLAPDQQEVLVLRFGQQLSLRETADVMHRSVNAVKSLQFRAVETLRGLMNSEPTETPSGAEKYGPRQQTRHL